MFRYRLETLLKYKKLLEERQQRSLALASRNYMEKLFAVKEIKNSLLKAQKNLLSDLENIHDSATLKIYYSFFAGSNIAMEEGNRIAEDALQIVDMERETLVGHMKNRKIIETHKGRMKERHEEEENKKERAFFDEMALTRFIHGKVKDEER